RTRDRRRRRSGRRALRSLVVEQAHPGAQGRSVGDRMIWSRREVLIGAAALAAGGTMERMRSRPIPRTGEQLPVIGMGTWRTFDVDEAEEARKPLRQVLRRLFE